VSSPIYEFKRGIVVTRTEPAQIVDDRFDYGYMGTPLRYRGLQDGLIYFERVHPNADLDKLFTLPMEVFMAGWGYYYDSDSIDHREHIPLEGLQWMLQDAVKHECRFLKFCEYFFIITMSKGLSLLMDPS